MEIFMIQYFRQIIKFQLKLASAPGVIEADKTVTKEMVLCCWQCKNGQQEYASCKYSQGLRLSFIQHNPPFLWVASAPMEEHGSNSLDTWCHFLLLTDSGQSQQRYESTKEIMVLQGSKWLLVNLGKVSQVLTCLCCTQECKSQRSSV